MIAFEIKIILTQDLQQIDIIIYLILVSNKIYFLVKKYLFNNRNIKIFTRAQSHSKHKYYYHTIFDMS